MQRRGFLARTAALAAAAALPRALGAASTRFTIAGDQFRLDGRPLVIRSGSMHYPRVPRPYWRDRMRKLRALGLNTVCTYVFWNAHEARPGEFNFSGNLDLAAYLRAAQAEGLHVILRPGPYICTEWDFGGFPAWLLAPPGMRVRSSDPRFLAASSRYLRRVGQEVAGLQSTRGGPILMVQVENEYGSYGQDHAYLAAIRDQITAAGFDVPLFTSNGPGPAMLAHGSLPGLTSVINFGDDDDPAAAFAQLAKFRPRGPRMCGEYWDGWFDHWGEHHHTTPAARAARGLDWMLAHGISANLYMAHGGTSFGFMAGANFSRAYQPDTTSYDYDAPLDEAGRPTPKFSALRTVLEKYLDPGEPLPALPPPLPRLALPAFALTQRAPLAPSLGTPRHSARPLPMEALGQSYGLVWYRTEIPSAAAGALTIVELRDYARAYQAGVELATWDRSRPAAAMPVTLQPGIPLDILVESTGRINFGPQLQDNLQGITQRVLLDGRELTGWTITPLPLDDLARLRFAASQAPESAHGPAFYRGEFHLDAVGDTFLDLRGWDKGYVWVNGHNLGRYWERGPQQTLFLPGCWLRPGRNQAVVFDWSSGRARTLSSRLDPLFS